MDTEYARLASVKLSTEHPLCQDSVRLSGQNIVGNSLSLSDLLKRAHVHYRCAAPGRSACATKWLGRLLAQQCPTRTRRSCSSPSTAATPSSPSTTGRQRCCHTARELPPNG